MYVAGSKDASDSAVSLVISLTLCIVDVPHRMLLPLCLSVRVPGRSPSLRRNESKARVVNYSCTSLRTHAKELVSLHALLYVRTPRSSFLFMHFFTYARQGARFSSCTSLRTHAKELVSLHALLYVRTPRSSFLFMHFFTYARQGARFSNADGEVLGVVHTVQARL